MSEEGDSEDWWRTLLGVITGLGAVIAALTGLVAAIQQTDWFASRFSESVAQPRLSASSTSGVSPAVSSAGASIMPTVESRDSPKRLGCPRYANTALAR